MATPKSPNHAGLPHLRATRRNSPYTWKVDHGQPDPFGNRSEASSASTPRWQSAIVSPHSAPAAIEVDSGEVSFEDEPFRGAAVECDDAAPSKIVADVQQHNTRDSPDTDDDEGAAAEVHGNAFTEAVARLAATVRTIAAGFLIEGHVHTISCVRLLYSTRNANPSDFDLVVAAYGGSFHDFVADHAGWYGIVYDALDRDRVAPAAFANERRMFPVDACPHPPGSDEFKEAAAAADIESLAPLIVKLRFVVIDRVVRAVVEDNRRQVSSSVAHVVLNFVAKRFPRAVEIHGQRSLRKFAQSAVNELRQEHRFSDMPGPLEERLREAGARVVFAK